MLLRQVPSGAEVRIAGLDASTKSGIAFTADGQHFVGDVIHFPKLTGFTRLAAMANRWGGLIDDWKPDLVVIEGYSFNSFGSSFSTLVEVGCILRNQLHLRGIEWYDVPPSVVKKFACGKGNAKKPVVAQGVWRQWGYTHPSDDVIDAHVLVRIGLEIARLGRVPIQLKGVHREGVSVT